MFRAGGRERGPDTQQGTRIKDKILCCCLVQIKASPRSCSLQTAQRKGLAGYLHPFRATPHERPSPRSALHPYLRENLFLKALIVFAIMGAISATEKENKPNETKNSPDVKAAVTDWESREQAKAAAPAKQKQGRRPRALSDHGRSDFQVTERGEPALLSALQEHRALPKLSLLPPHRSCAAIAFLQTLGQTEQDSGRGKAGEERGEASNITPPARAGFLLQQKQQIHVSVKEEP